MAVTTAAKFLFRGGLTPHLLAPCLARARWMCTGDVFSDGTTRGSRERVVCDLSLRAMRTTVSLLVHDGGQRAPPLRTCAVSQAPLNQILHVRRHRFGAHVNYQRPRPGLALHAPEYPVADVSGSVASQVACDEIGCAAGCERALDVAFFRRRKRGQTAGGRKRVFRPEGRLVRVDVVVHGLRATAARAAPALAEDAVAPWAAVAFG